MRLQIRLVLPADARLLPSTRRAMGLHLEALGVDPDCGDDIILALAEACANVVRHAFSGGPPGRFSVSADLTSDDVTIEVEDHGLGIAPETVRRAGEEVDPEATSGRGLFLIRQLMSSVEVEPVGGSGTRVRMRKKLRPAPASPWPQEAGRPQSGLAGSRPPAGLFRDPMF
ncbi:MAG TPA: ATP-binding protein [Acidimicrobiales bacterium]|nr:ATP-binding protein [Acidimicrobiales bacterium]